MDIQPGDIVANNLWWDNPGGREFGKTLIPLPLWIVADPKELDDETKRLHKIERFQVNEVGFVISRVKTYVLVMLAQYPAQNRWGWCDVSQLRRL